MTNNKLYARIYGNSRGINMKIGRVLGVILSFVFVILIYNKYNAYNSSQVVNNSFELIAVNSTFTSEGKIVDGLDSEDVEVLNYVNTTNSTAMLAASNIIPVCTGFGSNKNEDELLVENNLKITAAFSKKDDNVKRDLIELGKGEETQIYILATYEGDEYPINQVSCKYNVQIHVS